tara:strand:+ start:33 stop:224 length:192 start_codon:yes stop_codon:yes gene_type:complete
MRYIFNKKIVRLKNWLDQNQRSKSWLARECNLSPAAVHYWLNDNHYPSKKHRVMIKAITGVKL